MLGLITSKQARTEFNQTPSKLSEGEILSIQIIEKSREGSHKLLLDYELRGEVIETLQSPPYSYKVQLHKVNPHGGAFSGVMTSIDWS